MKRFVAIIAAFGLAACAMQTYRPPGGSTAYGTYPFKTVLPNANPPMVLEGTVLLLPDTVMMTLSGKSCAANPNPRGGSYSFLCAGNSFYFSKQNPLRPGVYQVPTMVWRMQQECQTYKTNPTTMAEVCSRYRQVRVETRMVLSGSLDFLAPKTAAQK